MFQLVQIIVPIGICVVLPVMVVWLIMRTRINADNKRTEVLLEAIKNNASIDADKLAAMMTKPQRTFEQKRYSYLLYGCIGSLLGIILGACGIIYNGSLGSDFVIIGGSLLAVGISFLIVFFASKKKQENKD